MKNIDLHTHSYYSDGENSFKELVNLATNKKLDIFSVVDHNYISPKQNDLKKSIEKTGALFIQGIEISCMDKKTNESLHILGYSRSFDIKKLNESLTSTIDGYNDRAKKIIEKLNKKYNSNFGFEKLKKETPAAFISRNHLIKELGNFLGNTLSKKELLQEVFIEEDDSWMIDSSKAIDIIKNNGGLAVLAHPGKLILKENFDDLIKKLVDYGLGGIEVCYPGYNDKTMEILKNTANKFNLLQTAGSDWHGKELSKQEELGISVSDELYRKILQTYKPTLSFYIHKGIHLIKPSKILN